MNDPQHGPWGPRKPSAKWRNGLKLVWRYPKSGLPFLVTGIAAIAGYSACLVIARQSEMQQAAPVLSQQPMLTPKQAAESVAFATAKQIYQDRLERCVQDGMGLDTFRVADPSFDGNARSLTFVLVSGDGNQALFVDPAQNELVQKSRRNPFQTAAGICQRYVFDGDWHAARSRLRRVKVDPKRIVYGG